MRTSFALLAGLAWMASSSYYPAQAANDTNKALWALQPLQRPVLPHAIAWPSVSASTNPIDLFIRARLKELGLTPSAPANPPALLRRLSFDLTGLPPTPEESAAFANAVLQNPQSAVEVAINQLLASPRHGERWARHWMDAAHFAETHGHDQDRIRTNAWPYRDYLIASFNADKPYARFVQEQVAGDVLFPEDPQATVALGFVAAGPWDESSLRDIREDTLDRQIGRYLDRDDMLTTVMQTFTSTTVHCARCHDHKFDPIPQRDYYALQAVFAGVDRANRAYDADPSIHRRRSALKARLAAVDQGDPAVLFAAESRREVETWEQAHSKTAVVWRVLTPDVFVSAAGATLTRQADGSVLASGQHGPTDIYTLTARTPLRSVTAVRLEVLTDDSLPLRGPGRESNGNLHLSEFQLLVFDPGANAPRTIALQRPTADFNQQDWTIAHSLDRNNKSAWGIHPREGEPHVAVFELTEKLTISEDARLTFVLHQLHGGHCIGRPRLSVTDTEPASRAAALPADLRRLLAIPAALRTESERTTLAKRILKDEITAQLAALPKPSLVYAAASDFEPDGNHKPTGSPRPVQMLKRGDITKPIEPAAPGALTCVSSLPARFSLTHTNDEGARRAALAQWLTDPANPLVWRSIVNRVWQHHFGRGLVDTPNDFGRVGGTPSHPELLDWLAVWFRDDAQGSLKQLHRLITTSATYRQASIIEGAGRDRLASVDPENRLLSRMNRTRLDAEQVRDAVLQLAGCLDLRMGGPGDLQFDLQPGHHVTPKVDYTKFDVTSRAAQRRSVYRFLFRTLPDPFMDALDCPAGDQLTPTRNASVTVQQALALWNNAFVAHYAERFATRLESQTASREAQVALACTLAFNRAPTPEELDDFSNHVAKHGLANLCRLLFNANEFMFVN